MTRTFIRMAIIFLLICTNSCKKDTPQNRQEISKNIKKLDSGVSDLSNYSDKSGELETYRGIWFEITDRYGEVTYSYQLIDPSLLWTSVLIPHSFDGTEQKIYLQTDQLTDISRITVQKNDIILNDRIVWIDLCWMNENEINIYFDQNNNINLSGIITSELWNNESLWNKIKARCQQSLWIICTNSRIVTRETIIKLNTLFQGYTLGIQLYDADDFSVALFNELQSLRWLSLSGNSITGRGLAKLNKSNLDFLDLSYTPIADISPLSIFKELKVLDLSGTNISTKTLQSVITFSNLRELYLEATTIGNNAFNNISSLTELRKLDISHTRITDNIIDSIKVLSKLEWLDISQTMTSSVSGIENLSKLTALNISSTWIGNKGMDSIIQLASLQSLDISKSWISNIQKIDNLSKLVELSVASTSISGNGIDVLNKLNNLKKLDLSYSRINDFGLSKLQQSTNHLEWLNFEGCKVLTKRSGAQTIESLSNIIYLNLASINIEASLNLKKLKNLRVLNLSGSKVNCSFIEDNFHIDPRMDINKLSSQALDWQDPNYNSSSDWGNQLESLDMSNLCFKSESQEAQSGYNSLIHSIIQNFNGTYLNLNKNFNDPYYCSCNSLDQEIDDDLFWKLLTTESKIKFLGVQGWNVTLDLLENNNIKHSLITSFYTPNFIGEGELKKTIEKLPELIELKMDGFYISEIDIKSIPSSLFHLALINGDLVGNNIAIFKQFFNLVTLNLDKDFINDDILSKVILPHNKNLKKLNLANAQITNNSIDEIIKNYPSIEELGFSGTNINYQGIIKLKQLHSLKKLDLSETIIYDGSEIISDDEDEGTRAGEELYSSLVYSLFDGFNRLKVINLNYTANEASINSKILKSLGNIITLEEIYLSGNQIADGLKYLKSLTGLHKLDLSGTDITDDHIKFLRNLISLDYLDLSNTSITPEGLQKLKTLPNLHKLIISGIDEEQKSYLIEKLPFVNIGAYYTSEQKLIPHDGGIDVNNSLPNINVKTIQNK